MYLQQLCTYQPANNLDHMKKLPPRGFGDTMNPQENKLERR